MNKTDIEGFEAPIPTGASAFCESYRGSSAKLNTGCGKLTEKNCNETSSDRSIAHTIATTNDNDNNKEKENKKDSILYKLLSFPLYNKSILRYKV
jgi:hypothetical protein